MFKPWVRFLALRMGRCIRKSKRRRRGGGGRGGEGGRRRVIEEGSLIAWKEASHTWFGEKVNE